MKRLYFFSISLVCYSVILSQTIRSPVSSPYIGLSAYSRNFSDVISATSQQAAIAGLKKISTGVFYERRYSLESLSYGKLAFALPTSSGNFLFHADKFGYKNFNELQAGIGYGRSLGEKADVGVQFNYYSLQIPVYGSVSAVNFEAGVLLHFSERLHGGLHVYNPVGGKLSKTGEEKLASVYKAGLGYEASEQVLVAVEMSKEENQNLNVKTGIHYQFLKKFIARIGIISSPSLIYAGAGFELNDLRIDIATSYHQQLGFSPGIMILYEFKEKK